MCKISGIISEYNPLHTGHIYHISKTRENCDKIVCIISGSFTQRGEPAVFDKWSRTKAALMAGADLVMELPTAFACAGAERFAFGAVRILSAFCDELSFGSESGDIDALTDAARFFAAESEEYKNALSMYLEKGMNYASARFEASKGKAPSLPNDTLATEYIKAIIRLKSTLKPVTIKRDGSGYLDSTLSAMPSAFAIRNAIAHGENCASSIPYYDLYKDQKPVFNNDMFETILYKLRTSDRETLETLPEVGEGLEARLLTAAKTARSYDELLALSKTKRYSAARIKRTFIHLLLGLDKTAWQNTADESPAAHILGVRKESKYLISEISKKLPVIIGVSDDCPLNVKLDVLAANVRAVFNGTNANRDMTEKFIEI